MREFDSTGLKLASGQAHIFENSIKRYKGSSAIFIRSFMYSREAQKIDRTLELDSASIIYNNNSNYLNKGKQKYDPDVIYWIGYIYRYWAYTFEMSSRRIYRIANADTMRGLYYAYHTMDPKTAIIRILEEKGIDYENNYDKQYESYCKYVKERNISYTKGTRVKKKKQTKSIYNKYS